MNVNMFNKKKAMIILKRSYGGRKEKEYVDK
jgi:hypothetical protein